MQHINSSYYNIVYVQYVIIMKHYKVIPVEEQLHSDLIRIKGTIESKSGVRYTMQDLIRHLINTRIDKE